MIATIVSLLLLAAALTVQSSPDPAAVEREAARAVASEAWDRLYSRVAPKLLAYRNAEEEQRATLSLEDEIAAIGAFVRESRESAPEMAWAARVFLATQVFSETLGRKREAVEVLSRVVAEADSAMVTASAALQAADILMKQGDVEGIEQLRELYGSRSHSELPYREILEEMENKARWRPGREFPELDWMSGQGQPVPRTVAGKLSLVFVFLSEHPASREALDRVAKVAAERSDRLRVVAISLDEDPKAIAQLWKDQGLEIPWICDGQGWKSPLARKLGISTSPASFLLDDQATILHVGVPPTELGEVVGDVIRTRWPTPAEPNDSSE